MIQDRDTDSWVLEFGKLASWPIDSHVDNDDTFEDDSERDVFAGGANWASGVFRSFNGSDHGGSFDNDQSHVLMAWFVMVLEELILCYSNT